MNHLYEAVNFQTRERRRGRKIKKALMDLILEHPLCLLRAPPDASLGIEDISTFVFGSPFTCHMGAVSLPLYYEAVRL